MANERRALALVVAVFLCACGSGRVQPGGQTPDAGLPPAGPPLVSLAITGEGRVVSNPAGIDCGVSCDATFAEGTVLNLTAAPAGGWSFAGWSGLCSGAQICSMKLTNSVSLGATFTKNPPPPPPPPPPPKPASLSLQFLHPGGTVTSSPAAMECTVSCAGAFPLGTVVTLTAAALPGFTAGGFGPGAACSGKGPCTFTITMVGDTTVQVDFAPIPRFTLSVPLSGSGAGTVVSTPAGIACGNGGGACSAQFEAGTQVTLTPSSLSGQYFLSWYGACHGSGACALTVSSDSFVGATFASAAADCVPLSVNPTLPRQVALQQGMAACYDAFEDDQGNFGVHGLEHGSTAEDWWYFNANGQYTTAASFLGTMNWQQQPQGALGVFDHSSIGYTNPAQGVLNFLAAPSGHISAAPDPTGGLLVAQRGQALMYRAGPVLRSGPMALASSGGVVGVGVDLGGNSLIITGGSARFGGGAISAQWFGPSGAATTGEFLLLSSFTPGPSTWFEARPLIGGGLAIRRVDGDLKFYTSQWLVTLAAGGGVVSPAPDWLASRPDTDLSVVRGQRAYALTPDPAANTECAQTLEVLTPYGASCSTSRLGMGQAICDTHRMVVGRQGSLFQTFPDSLEPAAYEPGFQCTWNLWQNLLR